MSVYFISVGGYIKVGYSASPERRFRNLFSSATAYAAPWDCPRALADRQLLGHIKGGKGEEWHAHQALDEFGVGCEFFLDEPFVRDYIDRCLRTGRVSLLPITRPEGPAEWVGQVRPEPSPEVGLDAALDHMFTEADIDKLRRAMAPPAPVTGRRSA